MSPEYHAWTHRPKRLGGTDPIDTFNVYYASKSSNTATVTTPWSVNGVTPQNQATALTNDLNGDYYEDMVDEGGINGIKILQDGLYFFRLELRVFFDEGGTHEIAPYIRANLLLKANAEGSGFAEGPLNYFCQVDHLTSDVCYLPDDDVDTSINDGLPNTNIYERSAVDWLRIRDLNTGTQNVPISLAWRIWSLGGTADWKYSATFEVFRMDEMLPNNSGGG